MIKKFFTFILCFGLIQGDLFASDEKAYKLFERLTGTRPVSVEALSQISALISEGKKVEAALAILEEAAFYNIYLRNWIAPLTNQVETPRVPLNDMTATIIGLIRDDVPFDQILYGDVLYVDPNKTYIMDNNNMYDELDKNSVDLSDKSKLVATTQSSQLGALPARATAGVLTTRAFGDAFIKAGTNRRAVRYLFKNFLCYDMEDLHDISAPLGRVRRDVDRAPSAKTSTFMTYCAGCHGGMDGFATAFSYYDFASVGNSERLVYTPSLSSAVAGFTPGKAVPKMNRNANVFPNGYVAVDDSWINYWNEGPNVSKVGFMQNGTRFQTGNGIKSLGSFLSKSKAFSSCMSRRVYEKVCLSSYDKLTGAQKNEFIRVFQESNYSMKQLFANAGAACVLSE